MPLIVTVSGLQKAAEHYDPVLRTLPLYGMTEGIRALHLNVQKVPIKDVITNTRRSSGGTRPYVPGANISYKDGILGFEHSSLIVEETYFALSENIHNYHDTDVQFLGGQPVDDKLKKHPLEYLILSNVIKTHAEDVLFQLFFGERNDAGTTAAEAFDGVNTQIDTLITAGKIAASKGNLFPTGALSAPANSSDTSAYDAVVAFILAAHPMLRSSIGGAPLLYISEDALVKVRAAYRNKVSSFQMPTMDQVKDAIREDAICPGLQFVTHVAYGTGSRLILCKDGLFDFGWNTEAASNFVQVRDPFEDPNIVQFWLQAAYGTRIRDWHGKLFLVNDQTNTSNAQFAGDDYAVVVAAPAISGTTPFDSSTSVTLTGPAGATIYYTTDGSTPTSASTAYSEALTLSATTTVKAIAVKDGVTSEVASKTFTKN